MKKTQRLVAMLLIGVATFSFASCGDDDDDANGGNSGNGSHSTISYSQCPDGEHPHAIDLGLPSGTKWACCNVGAGEPAAYGGYYAWGDTVTRETYKAENSLWYGQQAPGIRGTEYDVAYRQSDGKWEMPSLEQFQELMNGDSCTWTWKTAENGINGYEVVGPNGASIFLPASGFYYDSTLYDEGMRGGYWSSTPYSGLAYYLDFNERHGYTCLYWNRYFGRPVRAVLPVAQD